jgi:dienelactone hydrolase
MNRCCRADFLCDVSEIAGPPANGASSRRFEFADDGWISYSEREDLSHEVVRLLAAAQDGGSTLAECWLTLSRIEVGSDRSWSQEWIRSAEVSEARAESSCLHGSLISACRNWLRAVTYYRAAASPFDLSADLSKQAVEGMRRCAGNFVKHRSPAGEVFTIPWLADFSLQGYFLPSSVHERAPVVVCIGEPGSHKEEYLSKYASHAHERGMSLLSVDLHGTNLTVQPEQFAGGRKLEAAISHIMDFLLGRPGVDENRIAIVADGWSSSFVARAVASDPRFAAAVCDGGVWDLLERDFRSRQVADVEHPRWLEEPNLTLQRINCPLLITAGERGWLEAEVLTEFGSQLSKHHSDATFKLFTSAETAAMQGHLDNPTLANEMIFDWLEDRLGLRATFS